MARRIRGTGLGRVGSALESPETMRAPRVPVFRAPGDRRIAWGPTIALAAHVPVGFALQKVAARMPQVTETWYARRVYPRVHGLVAWAAEHVPVSLGETSLLVLAAFVLWRLLRGFGRWRAGRRSLPNLLGHALAQLLGSAGFVYAFFLLVWGLNYARAPFAESVGLEVRPATTEELAAVVEGLVERANARRAGLGEDGEGTLALRAGKAGVLAELDAAYAKAGAEAPVLAGRPPVARVAFASPLMTAFGISGIYWPFTGEPHVNGDVPDATFPFHACHEVAHQRGFAREDEANFIAYRACSSSSDPDVVYAGILGALLHAWSALHTADAPRAAALRARCSAAVLRDWEAIQGFWQPKTKVVYVTRLAGERTNQVYLKAQGQREGTRSYGRMVDLLIAEYRKART